MAHSQGIYFHLQPAWSKHNLTRPGVDLQAAGRAAISVACMVVTISFFFFHFLSWSYYYDCSVLLGFSMVCSCSYEVRQGLLQSGCTEQRERKCWDYQRLKWFLDSKTQLLMSRSVVRQFGLTPIRKGVLVFVVVFLVGRCHFSLLSINSSGDNTTIFVWEKSLHVIPVGWSTPGSRSGLIRAFHAHGYRNEAWEPFPGTTEEETLSFHWRWNICQQGA